MHFLRRYKRYIQRYKKNSNLSIFTGDKYTVDIIINESLMLYSCINKYTSHNINSRIGIRHQLYKQIEGMNYMYNVHCDDFSYREENLKIEDTRRNLRYRIYDVYDKNMLIHRDISISKYGETACEDCGLKNMIILREKIIDYKPFVPFLLHKIKSCIIL